MCRSNHNRHKDNYQSKSPQEIRSSFQSHLFVYLIVNAFVIFNSHSDSWQFMTIFWGIGLLSHYKKTKRALRGKSYACAKTQNDEYVDDIVPPPPTPNWKDRDLV